MLALEMLLFRAFPRVPPEVHVKPWLSSLACSTLAAAAPSVALDAAMPPSGVDPSLPTASVVLVFCRPSNVTSSAPLDAAMLPSGVSPGVSPD